MDKEKIFTEDEIVALKELAKQHMRMNEIIHGEKHHTPKPNVFPEGYIGPRSFAEAMAMNWDPHKQEWGKR